MVTFSYRTEPESPPDVQTIQKQMAIVAWQPGPNRVVSVPTQVGSWAGTGCVAGRACSGCLAGLLGLDRVVAVAGSCGQTWWWLCPAKLTVLHEHEVSCECFYGGFCSLAAGVLQVLRLGPGSWTGGKER